MSSHQTKTISSRLCWGQAALDVSRFWTQARLSEEVKPKLLLNCAASADSREDSVGHRPTLWPWQDPSGMELDQILSL